jgi:MFS family permease
MDGVALEQPMTGVLTRDGRLLFATRSVRMFGYGLLSVVLVLYLAAAGLDGFQIGVLLTLTLLGDAAISLWLTTHADRIGRRRTLIAGAALMALAGVAFVITRDPIVLLVAATIGVISPSGSEVGPFLAVEQAALTQTIPDRQRTRIFAWYNLAGSLATASGALVGGVLAEYLERIGFATLDSYRIVIVGYALVGVTLAVVFALVSPRVEAPRPADDSIRRRLGLHRSQRIVAKLSLLFGLDAFAGGFVLQSLIAYWFHVRFGADTAAIGALMFGANVLAGISALLAVRIAERIGLVRTMVVTHLPSNVLLILVPLMPTLELAAIVLLARFAISQMDVPTRQSYTQAVVEPDERSAAAGITGIARSLGAAVAPSLAAPLVAVPGLAAVPFLISGGLKIVYDLLLYRMFQSVRPPEERPPEEPQPEEPQPDVGSKTP